MGGNVVATYVVDEEEVDEMELNEGDVDYSPLAIAIAAVPHPKPVHRWRKPIELTTVITELVHRWCKPTAFITVIAELVQRWRKPTTGDRTDPPGVLKTSAHVSALS